MLIHKNACPHEKICGETSKFDPFCLSTWQNSCWDKQIWSFLLVQMTKSLLGQANLILFACLHDKISAWTSKFDPFSLSTWINTCWDNLQFDPGSNGTANSVAAVAAVRRFRAALWVPTSGGPQWVGVGWVPGSPVQGSSRQAPGIRRHGLVHHYGW